MVKQYIMSELNGGGDSGLFLVRRRSDQNAKATPSIEAKRANQTL